MCGRFTITAESETITKRFGTTLPLPPFQPRYNAAPGQLLPVILNASPHEVTLARWGFLPLWTKVGAEKAIINARAETLTEKHTFKGAFKIRRCLVIADGFFEWRQTKEGKIPYYIKLRDGQPFAFAGIYSMNKDEGGQEVPRFAIITRAPNELLAPIHNRMPAILEKFDERGWLIEKEPTRLFTFLKPYPAAAMKAFPVSKLVNAPEHNKPEVIYPLR